MSDAWQGPGWWLASDGHWYPPELHPDASAPPTGSVAPSGPPSPGWGVSPASGWGIPPGPLHPDPTGAPDALSSWAPNEAPAIAPPVPPYPGPGSPGSSPAGPSQPVYGPSTFTTMQAPSVTSGRFGRALRLVGTGFTMARDEPGLMAVPAVSFVIQVVVIGVAVLLIRPGIVSGSASSGSSTSFGASGSSANGPSSLSGAQWVVIVVAGVLVMFVSVVSHATIIARVMARFHGRRVSNAKAAGAAMTKSPQLLLWAFINYVVHSVLRSIADRGILGWLVGSLLRAGWLIASFFVVPVILFENRGAFAAVKRSVELCRSRWGENVVGNSALAVIGVGAVLADVAVGAVLGLVYAPLGMVVGVLGFIGILLVLTVASAAFNAALYWYAVTGQAPGAYSVGDMQSAYRERPRRTGVYGF